MGNWLLMSDITRCLQCDKQFTDLEADQLFDFTTGEFKCTHCGG